MKTLDSHLMDKEVLCILDTRQIQRFLFRSNSYVDTLGGSDLLLHILGDAIRFALHNIDTPLSEGEYDLSAQAEGPVPYFENPAVKFQLIINAAGNAMFIVRTGALAQKIIRKVSRYYLDHGYSLNVAAAAVEKTDNLGHDIFNLYRKLNAIKSSAQISDPLGALPVVMRERRTGDPVVDFDKERGDYVSRASQLRREESTLRKLIVGPDELPLTRAFDGKDYWSALHADGNNLGITIGRILQTTPVYSEGIRTRRQINLSIVNNYRRVMTRTMSDMEEFFRASGGKEGDFQREFVVVHQGGDDVNCICKASLAFPFLHFFYKNLAGSLLWDTPKLKLPLYICAGVAFVTRDVGFHAASVLAEECCKSAKTVAKKEYNLRDGLASNWIDYQVCGNPNAQKLDLLRERAYITREGVHLGLRPYCLDPVAENEIFSYRNLLRQVKRVQGLRLTPLQQRMMRESYATGKQEFAHWIELMKQRGTDLAEYLGEPLWQGRGKEYHATWFDAAELSDFIPAAMLKEVD